MVYSNSAPPFFSIVLPVYNVGKYIDRALESCVNQRFNNIEIIVIDDFGTDDSILKAKKWAELDSRVRVVCSDVNRGTYHARELGVTVSSGKYVVFLDPDDALRLDALSLIFEAVVGEDPDIVFFGYEEVPNNSKRKITFPQAAQSRDELMLNLFIKKRGINYGTPGKAYLRSSLIEGLKLANVESSQKLTYAEDLLLLYVVALSSKKLATLENYIYRYSKHPGTATSSVDQKSSAHKMLQIDEVIAIISRIVHKDKVYSSQDFEYISGYKLISRLLIEKALANRYVKDGKGKSQYLISVYNAWKMRGNFSDIARIILYLFSCGRIKR